MSYESVVKRALLEKAILLFGEGGYEGVTTHAVAKVAGVSEGSIFKHFKSKEGLYRRALTEVLDQAEQDMGKALLDIFEAHKNQAPREFALEALEQWYVSLSQPAARFLQQVLISDPALRDKAYQPIGRVVKTLAAALEGKTRQKSGSHARESAETLVTALFQYKVMQNAALEKEQLEKVKARVACWLEDVLIPD